MPTTTSGLRVLLMRVLFILGFSGMLVESCAPWAQPVLAFDLVESVGQDAPCARC